MMHLQHVVKIILALRFPAMLLPKPSQYVPIETAHRTLENLSCKHTTCLPRFFPWLPILFGGFCVLFDLSKSLLMVAVITRMVLDACCEFLVSSAWLLLFHRAF